MTKLTRIVLTISGWLVALVVFIGGAYYGRHETHPQDCTAFVADYNGRLKHGQAVTEKQREWYAQCTETAATE